MGDFDQPLQLDQLIDEERSKKVRVYFDNNPELKKLPPKQVAYITSRIEHPERNEIEHCRAAGYSENTSPAQVQKMLAGKLSHTLADVGIYESTLGGCLARGLECNKTHFVKVPVVDSDGKISGYKIETRYTPDEAMRFKYFQTALKLGNYFPALKVEHSGTMTHEHKVAKLFQEVPMAVLERSIKKLEEEGIDAEFEELEDDSNAA